MTRINTNVPSLVAQNRLQRSNQDLQTRLNRLSTGLKINKGSDDPAGLIASEALRSEITSLNKAVGNTRRADQSLLLQTVHCLRSATCSTIFVA